MENKAMPEENQEQKQFPPQQQEQRPGIESEMTPRPVADDPQYKPAGKLQGKVALITGGDSGIGRAVAVAFAKEGADCAIVYLEEHSDAQETQKLVEKHGQKCLLLPGDVGQEGFCQESVQKTVAELGKLDILVNNASEQHPQESIEDISAEQLERTFRTNVFGYFFMVKAALKHLKEGSAIINTTSLHFSTGKSGKFRRRHANETRRTARRSRHLLCVFGQR
jgi:NAD(P)-dependent dehydrogenase (short-subunit alcohol dehydrogenase family)